MNPPTEPDRSEAGLALEFPSMQGWTYLNHAAISPWPERVRQAIAAFTQSNLADGPERYAQWLADEQDLRERYARLIGAGSAGEISLVPNTTEGIAIVAGGLDWQAGDNVVSAQGEFPSNRMAWAALAQRGVSLRSVDLRGAEPPEQALLNAMDERTRVLTVSAVQWTDGLRLKLNELGRACRAAGVFFFVDAIQQLGALRMDVQDALIDGMAAGSHKWQMAPEGQGLFYCRSAWRERLRPLKLGWRMLQDPYDFYREDRDLADSGQRFEPGTPNTLGQQALNAALELQEYYGQAWIEQRVLGNTARLLEGLNALDVVSVVSPQEADRRSGIIAIRPGTVPAPLLARRLKAQNIVTVARGGLVRLSPHFYQPEAMMDRVVDAVEAASGS